MQGFNSALRYFCMLSAYHKERTGTNNMETSNWQLLNETRPAIVVSSSEIFCLPTWSYYSGMVNFTLLRDGQALAYTTAALKASHVIPIKERWSEVRPRAMSAIGTTITIFGHGFAGVCVCVCLCKCVCVCVRERERECASASERTREVVQ